MTYALLFYLNLQTILWERDDVEIYLMAWKTFHNRLWSEIKLTINEMVHLEEKWDSDHYMCSSIGWMNR